MLSFPMEPSVLLRENYAFATPSQLRRGEYSCDSRCELLNALNCGLVLRIHVHVFCAAAQIQSRLRFVGNCALGADPLTGTRTINVEPAPSTLSTSTSP
jgi:hypothetical protein